MYQDKPEINNINNTLNGGYVNNFNMDAIENYDDRNDVVEIDLLQLLNHFLMNWKILVIALIVGVALGWGYQHFFVGTTYSSDASIFIADTDKTIDITDLDISTQLSVDYQKIIVSRKTLKDVIAYTGINMDYRTLRGLVSVSQEKDSHIITITVTTTDKNTSRILADAMMRVGARRIQEVTTSGNPTVVDYATRDAITTIRNGYRRYPGIGGLLGVGLVMALLLLQFMMDNSFKSEDEIVDKLKKPVIGGGALLRQQQKPRCYQAKLLREGSLQYSIR